MTARKGTTRSNKTTGSAGTTETIMSAGLGTPQPPTWPESQVVPTQPVVFPPQQPLDYDYTVYIQRKLRTGQISGESAVAALRAREPDVTAERIQALLTEGEQT